MKVCRVFLCFTVSIFLAAFNALPGAVQTQSTPTMKDVIFSYDFGRTLTISGIVETQSKHEDVFLVLQPENQPSRQIPVSLSESNAFKLMYDLKQDPLSPFSRIYFWLQFGMPSSSTIVTPSYWFDYIDDRYDWKSQTSRIFEIYWISGDSSTGSLIQEIATTGLESATQILPISPELPIRIFVYPDSQSLQETMTMTHQEWVAGHASPQLGVVLVSDGEDPDGLLDLRRQIPHEIMHILQYQATGVGFSNTPAWILEGLATSVEDYPDPDMDRLLLNAYSNDQLLPWEDLCRALPLESEKAAIAYAQSTSLIDYIRAKYGSGVFIPILKSAATGLSCEENVRLNLGVSLARLERDWNISTFEPDAGRIAPESLILLIGLTGIVIIGSIVWSLKKYRHQKQHGIPNE